MNQSNQNNNVSVGQWIVTYLIMIVPVVNIVMLFVWGFGSSTAPSKSSWAKATLIWLAVGIVLSILFSSVLAGIFAAMY